jgi:cytochrome c-type biogenesis protein CcmH/NrfF
VDITRDVMQMVKEGKTTAEMRAFIDAKYSAFGPSNMP